MARSLHTLPSAMEVRRRSTRRTLRSTPWLILLLIASLVVSPLPADQAADQAPQPADPAQEPSAEFTEEVSVSYVLVPVVVRSGARYVKNLDKGDFRLLVDGKQVPIQSFEYRWEAPSSVVVMQDLSGSMEGKSMELSREAVQFFLGKALPGDEFAIATFASGSTQVDVPFTADLSVVREAVGAWKAWGTTALHDAVTTVPGVSQAGKNPKRFAILITDGVDNASRITPERAREIVREAQVPVYVLGVDSGDPFAITEQGKKIFRYADVLNLLATTSGGRYYSISGREQLQEALDAILDDLRHQYVLGFATGDGPSRQRDLKVQVEAGNRTVLFRRGYKGPPPAG
jgi:Ca-activated chloride channel family protein